MATIKKHIFTIGIAIIALIVFMYGIKTFYPDPSMDCWSRMPTDSESMCLQENGKWMMQEGPGMKTNGYCDFNDKCNNLREPYSRNVAIIAFVLGLGLLYYGIVGKKIAEQTTAGFVGGGLLVIVYAIIQYWEHIGDTLRFFLVLIIFGLLIWIGNKYKDYFK